MSNPPTGDDSFHVGEPVIATPMGTVVSIKTQKMSEYIDERLDAIDERYNTTIDILSTRLQLIEASLTRRQRRRINKKLHPTGKDEDWCEVVLL